VDVEEDYERCLNSTPEDSLMAKIWKLFPKTSSAESSKLNCPDVLKEGCIAGTEDQKCYCYLTSKELTLEKALNSDFLNIYHAASKNKTKNLK
jgi:hypothetical protein